MFHCDDERKGKMKKIYRLFITIFCIGLIICLSNYRTYAIENNNIGSKLDGDYAYIADAGLLEDKTTSSNYSIRTGTAPFDQKEGPGNDQSALDNVIRSFDIVSYTTYFRSKVRNDAPYSAYQTGVLHFEFIIFGNKDEIQFETNSMGWLTAKTDVQYEITQKEYQGKTCQVLKGSYLWQPSDDNPSAIGESYQELTIVLRALAMQNNQIIQPIFTYWLDYNQVDESNIVTGSQEQCKEHQEVEYKSINTPEIKVSAAPCYNIQLKTCDERTQYLDTFDFSTGNDLATNKGKNSIYGRASVIGITLQMVGKDAQSGLKGCEYPQGDIEFDIDLDSKYLGNDGDEHNVTQEYIPLVWSIDGNTKSNTQNDNRKINGSYTFASGGAPFNQGNDYASCFDGGSWIGNQENHSIHLKITDYQLNLNQLPYTDANVNKNTYTYYNPLTMQNYWEVSTACFSAGELWFVQPFYNNEGKYIVDQYGTGSFNITLTDKNLKMTSVSGQNLTLVEDNSNQMVQEDDQVVVTSYLEQEGYIDQNINYQKYNVIQYGSSLTNGCFENGKDWILPNNQLNIQEMIKHNNAEGIHTGVGYDDLIKFDDSFFELESVDEGGHAGLDHIKRRFLYGAKKDKTGWNHQGLKPNEENYDLEMMQSTADDLIFFETLDELKSQGYTCVAVLWEARGVASSQSMNCYIGLKGHVKEGAIENQVYMVTHSARGWNKGNVQENVAKYYHKEIQELTDDDYIDYMQNHFYSKKDNHLYENYEDSFWINDYTNNEGLKNYKKSTYDISGYVGGSAGLSYGDSCLLVTYATKITKDTAQTGNGVTKKAYDLDTNQRVVDYILKPSATKSQGEHETTDAQLTTHIIVEDTLPKGLKYISYSSYYGGTYKQIGQGKQGVIENGKSLEPEVTVNKDGTTLLKWTIENATIDGKGTTYFEPIYYSCEIGTLGIEETDVSSNDQLLNSVKIYGIDEQKRDFNNVNGNYAELGIQVSKNNAVSLSKIPDQSLVEKGENMSATLNIGNNADNNIDTIAIDSLPYDQDSMSSSFNGKCFVTKLTVQDISQFPNLELFYTNDLTQREKTSQDYTKEQIQTGWEKLAVDENGNIQLPSSFTPVAIAFIGTIPSQKTLKMYITMSLPDALPGDYVVNRLTKDNLESDARFYVVSRNIEGKVWHDVNQNGLYEDEKKINGVKALLMKLKENGDPDRLEDYEEYRAVETGYQLDVSTGKESTYEEGKYRFTNLPAGTFGVLFKDGTFSMYGYVTTLENQGDDDTIDSDANEQKFISNIVMPEKEKMLSAVYESKYHDLGIYDHQAPFTGLTDNEYIVGIIILVFAVIGFIGIKKYKDGKKNI